MQAENKDLFKLFLTFESVDWFNLFVSFSERFFKATVLRKELCTSVVVILECNLIVYCSYTF